MKSMILYTTKSGATKECAELLASRLGCPAYDITQINTKADVSACDTIILGTGVRMGKIYKPAKDFIRKNMDVLLDKKIAIFFCNAYADTFQKAMESNLPQELIEHAVSVKSFGGKPPFTKPVSSDWMNLNNMNDFVDKLSNV